MARRVVVTGVGLVSPLGIGTDETWRGLVEGRSGAGLITRFDTTDYSVKIACEVKGFDPAAWFEPKEIKKFDTFVHYAVAAADMALAQSGLQIRGDNADRVGVVIGSGIGGFPMIEHNHQALLERGPRRVSPVLHPAARSSTCARG